MSTQPLILNNNDYYDIAASSVLYHKFILAPLSAVVFTVSHTNWAQNQNWSMRMWVSTQIRGDSVLREPITARSQVSLTKAAVSWGLKDHQWQPTSAQLHMDPMISWLSPGSVDVPYYLLIENMENKPNRFYLRMTTVG